MADRISSLGLVAISSSNAVISITLAAGTACSTVPLADERLLRSRVVENEGMAGLLPFQLRRSAVVGTLTAVLATQSGGGNRSSAPPRLKMDMLRLATLFVAGVLSPIAGAAPSTADCWKSPEDIMTARS